jgi:coatomer protein complex subunit gamma
MVQFHALALLRGIKRHDRLAVSKVVSTLMKSGMRSPLGLCLLMRYALSLHAADAAIIPTPVRQAPWLRLYDSSWWAVAAVMI